MIIILGAVFQEYGMIRGYLSVSVHIGPGGTDPLTEICLYCLTSISAHTSWVMSAMFNNYSPYHMYTQTEGTSSEINQAQNSCQLMQKIGHKKSRKHLRCDTTKWIWKVCVNCEIISSTEPKLRVCKIC